MKKILFTDLDGTLLKDDKTVSQGNRQAIQKMLDQGHYLVVATGRPVESGYKVVKSLGLTMPGCYMVAYNGAVVYDCAAGSILAERTIPIEYVEYLFQEAEHYQLHIQTYTDQHLITSNDTKELQYYAAETKMPYKLVDNVPAALEREPNKILLASLDRTEVLRQFQQDHLDWEMGKCNSFFSCEEYLEYCPKDTNKGTGIRYLSQILNIPMEATFAVGDERNDIAMLKAAHTGIAMCNARAEAKEAADYVTQRNNEQDGVAEVIEKFILGKNTGS